MYHIATPSDRPVDTPGINKATPPSGEPVFGVASCHSHSTTVGGCCRRAVSACAVGPIDYVYVCSSRQPQKRRRRSQSREGEGRREGETDASSRHRLKISFQFGPRRRRLLLARPIDRLGSIRRGWMKSLCNSATAWHAEPQAVVSRLACLPSHHGRCFQYCFCQMSAVAQSAMQPGASAAGCCAERGMCHPSEGRPSLERGIHPRMSDVGK